jgi:hypothetical protein
MPGSPWEPPTRGAVTQARQRLGAEVVREVFERVARPAATPATAGAWLMDACHQFDDSKRNVVAHVGRRGDRWQLPAVAAPQCPLDAGSLVDATLSGFDSRTSALSCDDMDVNIGLPSILILDSNNVL